jgi:hypothetical protein
MTEQVRRSWWGRNWIWVVPAGCLIPVVLCGGFVVLILAIVFGAIKSSAPYTESLAAVKQHPQVRELLGDPIEPEFFVSGNINVSGSSGDADISYSVSGPKGSGTVYVVAEKAAGEWDFKTMALESAETGDRIDLLLLGISD